MYQEVKQWPTVLKAGLELAGASSACKHQAKPKFILRAQGDHVRVQGTVQAASH